jgi:hypothetical protein
MFIMPLGGRVSAAPLAVQGSIDLSAVDWRQEPIIDLSGGWRFYWNQLLSPEQLASGLDTAQ